jgi:hypothetical protein
MADFFAKASSVGGGGGGGGVTSLDLLTGALTLTAGTGISVTDGVSSITIASTSAGDVTLAAVGSSPNANAASISSQVLNLQPASGSFPGVMTTGTQTIAGDKTFSTGLNSPYLKTAAGANAIDLANRWIWNGGSVLADFSGAALQFFGGWKTYSGDLGNTLTFQYANGGTSHTVLWPASQGAASTFLRNDGSGNLSWYTGATANTGSTIALRDVNGNGSFVNAVSSTTSTVTSAQTITMTAGSARIQQSTGSSTITYKLPVATNLYAGQIYEFNNNSSGTATIQDSAAGAVTTVTAGAYKFLICTDNSTAAGVWDVHAFLANGSISATAGTTVPGTLAATTTVTGTQLISTVATGTAPLTVASTTLVTNLHAAVADLATTVTTNANLTGDVTSSGNATTYSGTVPINKGGTNNASLAVTAGGTIYSDGSKLVNVGAGTTGQFLKSNGSSAPTWAANNAGFTAATVQKFTSGSGNYTTPSGVLYIIVKMVGGGGGGGGGGTNGTGGAGTAGNDSTFGTSLLTAAGGGGGATGHSQGTAGGSPTVSSPAIDIDSTIGGTGGGSAYGAAASSYPVGGYGGMGYYGGGGSNDSTNDPKAGVTNSGGGGGGGYGGSGAAAYGGGGGGSGAWVHAIIVPTTNQVFAYVVGGTAAGGTLGTSGDAGAAGAAGRITVVEVYQ